MSDINPMTGQSMQSAPTPDRVHVPRSVFENKAQEPMTMTSIMDMSEEERVFNRIAEKSQLTRFATGDLNKDIQNFLTMRKIGRLMTGLMGDDGQ